MARDLDTDLARVKEQHRVRGELIKLGEALRRRDQLLHEGKAAGLPVAEMGRLVGLNRQHIYAILQKYRKANNIPREDQYSDER